MLLKKPCSLAGHAPELPQTAERDRDGNKLDDELPGRSDARGWPALVLLAAAGGLSQARRRRR